MYTYVFAYYLKKNNQSTIFEVGIRKLIDYLNYNKSNCLSNCSSDLQDNQKDLETATEMLSEYLERDITQENLVDIKQKVQDKYRYCDSRRRVLAEHVYEGYDKEWWEYND